MAVVPTPGVLDTHYAQRGRDYRLARLLIDAGIALGVGIDETTALRVDLDGEHWRGRVIGNGSVSVLQRIDPKLLLRRQYASGETLDLKPYEADMRHLIDTYIEAKEPRKISPFDSIGLLDLIVKTGIADAIAHKLADMQGKQQAIAETIENNVRSKIVKDALTDPAYFAKMSAVLDELIRLRKLKALEYEEYLARIADLAARVVAGHSDDGIPLQRCMSCGPTLVLRREQVPGDRVYCRNCGGEYRIGASAGDRPDAVEPTGRRGSAQNLAPAADAALIERFVRDTEAAAFATSVHA